MTDLTNILGTCQKRVDSLLDQILDNNQKLAPRLVEAMRYSTLLPGKRIRPFLVYQCAQLVGGELANADPSACAIEMMHSYSLIHDDLPAMDDDNLRRGQPSCHKKFDEATAILAGDALQSLAYQVLLDPRLLPHANPNAGVRLLQTTLLARAAGKEGMVAGQNLDLQATGKTLSLEQLEQIHRHKTGALLQSSIELGLLAANCHDKTIHNHLKKYGQAIGLAFQIQDDILDVTANQNSLGKTPGKDQALNKPTYVSLLGLAEAKTLTKVLCTKAHEALYPFANKAKVLKELASYITQRTD